MSLSKSPHVVWTFRAQRRLKQAQLKIQTAPPSKPEQIMANLETVLALAFPDAPDIIVNNLYDGFRVRIGEHILALEVHDEKQAGNYVMKVKKNPCDLQREWEAWRECLPPSIRHDIVLMAPRTVRDGEGTMVALLYEDAQQSIDVDNIISLEEAFQLSVRHGAPTPESLASVLTDLFTRLGRLFYAGACTVDPTEKGLTPDPEKTLRSYFVPWEKAGEPRNARRIANAVAMQSQDRSINSDQDGFLDPVSFLEFVLDKVQASPVSNYVPEMMRGPAHGDLHGRNVLVGIVDDETRWPALFDYENMGANNLPGWDFVKLETELKIRAYMRVFGGMSLQAFVSQVYRFETSLSVATELHRREGGWPAPIGKSPEDRLRNLLLVIRRLAAKHLGDTHNRPGRWLEEYYFLLSCYGVYAGKFPNLQPNELTASFVSAGVAAARYFHSRKEKMDTDTADISEVTS